MANRIVYGGETYYKIPRYIFNHYGGKDTPGLLSLPCRRKKPRRPDAQEYFQRRDLWHETEYERASLTQLFQTKVT